MRQKELRIALVCYGGVSLAVYMHGVTKEIWHLARASRDHHRLAGDSGGSAQVFRRLIERIEERCSVRLRVLPDILSGASAGGINAVFLAQAIHSGQSLDPLTSLWLDKADVDQLTDPKAEPLWRFAKFWAQPIANWILSRPGNVVSESVAPETRREVRRKVSRFVRGRWFQPPFSGIGFSGLLFDAFGAMAAHHSELPLLPAGHPIDLSVTTTDYYGHKTLLHLDSPAVVEETEHRLPISFCSLTPRASGTSLADPLELCFAARATASFPGAFPPLQPGEIDQLAIERDHFWNGRGSFLGRIMPVHVADGTADSVSLIDGSVLNNAPFDEAIGALESKPAQREVDRRVVYIDPRPDRWRTRESSLLEPVGFFGAIFGSLSTIPREQPIRDNLELLERHSLQAQRIHHIIENLRPEIERTVEKLFGRTFFLDSPTPRRLRNWRAKAQQAAAERAGYAYNSYAQAKYTHIIEKLAHFILAAGGERPEPSNIASLQAVLRAALEKEGFAALSDPSGGASEAAIEFFRAHDAGFRIRRLRLLIRRLSQDWEADHEVSDVALESARDALYRIINLYFERERVETLGPDHADLADQAVADPLAALARIAQARKLAETDDEAEALFARALDAMPKNLRRQILLAYLGFPFYDIATLNLLQNEGLTEFEAVKVDRISPDDAPSIRTGGSRATLRGTEFYNFGAFFSRAYRENDYLWGRLHGAERMVDLVCSTVDSEIDQADCLEFKREAFLAILDEEERIGNCSTQLLAGLRDEVIEKLG